MATGSGESGTDAKHGRPVVVVMAVEEFERLNVSAPTATGMRVKRSNLQQIEKRGAIRRATSHAIDNGAPITLVSQTLGHADLKTTSVYAHARPNESSSRYLKRR